MELHRLLSNAKGDGDLLGFEPFRRQFETLNFPATKVRASFGFPQSNAVPARQAQARGSDPASLTSHEFIGGQTFVTRAEKKGNSGSQHNWAPRGCILRLCEGSAQVPKIMRFIKHNRYAGARSLWPQW